MRKRIGQRKYSATFLEHNGDQDATGNPTYSDPSDWVPVVANWPAELIGTGSGETIRGRQVTAQTTHVLYGEWFGGVGIKAVHRCRVVVNDEEIEFSVSAPPLDMDGLNSEMRVELKQEST